VVLEVDARSALGNSSEEEEGVSEVGGWLLGGGFIASRELNPELTLCWPSSELQDFQRRSKPSRSLLETFILLLGDSWDAEVVALFRVEVGQGKGKPNQPVVRRLHQALAVLGFCCVVFCFFNS